MIETVPQSDFEKMVRTDQSYMAPSRAARYKMWPERSLRGGDHGSRAVTPECYGDARRKALPTGRVTPPPLSDQTCIAAERERGRVERMALAEFIRERGHEWPPTIQARQLLEWGAPVSGSRSRQLTLVGLSLGAAGWERHKATGVATWTRPTPMRKKRTRRGAQHRILRRSASMGRG